MSALVPPLEEDLAPPVARFFMAQGWQASPEVAFNQRIADFILVRGDEVAAVELKLRDWRGALKQAIAYQIGVRYAWVGLPLVVAARLASKSAQVEKLAEKGVGLLGVNWPQDAEGADVRVLLEAKPSPRLLPFLEDGVKQAALAVTYEPGEAMPEKGRAVARVGWRRT